MNATVPVSGKDLESAFLTTFQHPDYRLLDKIGEGGFGCVYRAQKTNTGQTVAIKFLTRYLAGSADSNEQYQRYVQRFERETQLCAQLHHPNIVQLMDKGVCNDIPFAVFEYVQGQTLKDYLIENGAMSAVETAQIMMQLLDAIACAHQQGILHRDIKPANLMLTQVGLKKHLKVLDFGIGTVIEHSRHLACHTLTMTDEVLGTPAYSAPEQLRGEPCTLKTDLYVWGLVFIECLTGRRAVSGASVAAIMHQQLSPAMIPLPQSLLSHPVSHVLRRVLEKKAYRRNAEAAALYAELGKINFANLLVGGTGGIQDCESLLSTQTDVSQIAQSNLVERKQISVLSLCVEVCVVGDIEPDVEILDTLLRDIQFQCVDTVVRYGGYHVGTLGDELLFYFGYPQVSDNDLRLCGEAAMALVAEFSRRNEMPGNHQGLSYGAGIGIHTGEVVCFGDEPPSGSVPNLSLKLARAGKRNQILCSQSSRRLMAKYMSFAADPQSIGQSSNTPSYELLRAKDASDLDDDQIKASHECFFGREDAKNRLESFLQAKNNAQNGFVLLGEAGIGKSRLLAHVCQYASEFKVVKAQCWPEHQYNGLFPVFTWLESKFNWQGLNNQQKREQLEDFITSDSQTWQGQLNALKTRRQALRILLAWMNVETIDSTESDLPTADKQQLLLFELLSVLLLVKGKTENGLNWLFVIEDLHWVDSITVAFVEQFIRRLEGTAERVIVTARIFDKWLDDDSICHLTLEKLPKDSASAIISALFNNKPVAKGLSEALIKRTDGIPLFIEALVESLTNAGLVEARNGIIDFVSIDSIEQLPLTLKDSMQHQLDSLIEGKEILQLASVIGREFEYGLLVKTGQYSEAVLKSALAALVSANVIALQPNQNGQSYRFKHALMHEAAYQSLTSNHRIQFHQMLAQLLNNVAAPHILAFHFHQGQMPEQARYWYEQAGDLAAKVHAHLQYINFYQKAVALLDLPEDIQNVKPEVKSFLLKVWEKIADGEIDLGRHRQGRAVYQLLMPLIVDDALLSATVHYKLGRSQTTCREFEGALKCYERAVMLLGDWQNNASRKPLFLKINSAQINTYYAMNDLEGMARQLAQYQQFNLHEQDQLQQAYALEDEFQLRTKQLRYALDEKTLLLAKTALNLIKDTEDRQVWQQFKFNYVLALYFFEDYPGAFEGLKTLLAKGLEVDDSVLVALCHTYLAVCCRRMDEVEQTEHFALKAEVSTASAGMDGYCAVAKANLAWVAWRHNQSDRADALLAEANETWHDIAYPVKWLGAMLQLQLLSEQSEIRDTAKNIESVKRLSALMLHDNQQRLSDEMTQKLVILKQGNIAKDDYFNLLGSLLGLAKSQRMI